MEVIGYIVSALIICYNPSGVRTEIRVGDTFDKLDKATKRREYYEGGKWYSKSSKLTCKAFQIELWRLTK